MRFFGSANSMILILALIILELPCFNTKHSYCAKTHGLHVQVLAKKKAHGPFEHSSFKQRIIPLLVWQLCVRGKQSREERKGGGAATGDSAARLCSCSPASLRSSVTADWFFLLLMSWRLPMTSGTSWAWSARPPSSPWTRSWRTATPARKSPRSPALPGVPKPP